MGPGSPDTGANLDYYDTVIGHTDWGTFLSSVGEKAKENTAFFVDSRTNLTFTDFSYSIEDLFRSDLQQHFDHRWSQDLLLRRYVQQCYPDKAVGRPYFYGKRSARPDRQPDVEEQS